jgi:hypothetical protein
MPGTEARNGFELIHPRFNGREAVVVRVLQAERFHETVKAPEPLGYLRSALVGAV